MGFPRDLDRVISNPSLTGIETTRSRAAPDLQLQKKCSLSFLLSAITIYHNAFDNPCHRKLPNVCTFFWFHGRYCGPRVCEYRRRLVELKKRYALRGFYSICSIKNTSYFVHRRHDNLKYFYEVICWCSQPLLHQYIPLENPAYGTAKSGVGIASMGAMKPDLVMRNIIPVIMAGVLGIYGLIVAVILNGTSKNYRGTKNNIYAINLRLIASIALHTFLHEL